MKTLEEFIEDHGITANVVEAAENPNWEQDDSYWEASHWTVRLIRMDDSGIKAVFDVPFSQSAAHKNPPTVEEVLDCLASDASGVSNNQTFEDWCCEYGYGTDSRKAERLYSAVVDQTDSLESFLGTEAYNELLWEVENL